MLDGIIIDRFSLLCLWMNFQKFIAAVKIFSDLEGKKCSILKFTKAFKPGFGVRNILPLI